MRPRGGSKGILGAQVSYEVAHQVDTAGFCELELGDLVCYYTLVNARMRSRAVWRVSRVAPAARVAPVGALIIGGRIQDR